LRNIVPITGVWLCRGVASILFVQVSKRTLSAHIIARCFADVLLAGVHLALVHRMYHTLLFLELMLDMYSVEFYEKVDWRLGVFLWNTVGTILHQFSIKIDTCFLALQTSAAISFMCFAARALHIVLTPNAIENYHVVILALLEIPSLIMTASAFILLIKAVGITETCARTPSVVNSAHVTLETTLGHNRQLLVSFINNSNAGFISKGVRLNATMLMNYCYLGGAIVCGIFTTALSMSRN